MTEPQLIAAIREDYDNLELRLTLADWYEQHGQADRAVFIRACVTAKQYPFNSPKYEQATVKRRDAWMRCRPGFWDEMSAGLLMSLFWDLGMYTVSFAHGIGTESCSPRAVKKVGRQKWLGTAYEQGWLLRMDMRYDDGSLGKRVAKWKPPLSEIPLWVKPAPQINDAGLETIFKLPQLCGISFLSSTMEKTSAVLKLGEVKRLRRLKMDIRFLGQERWSALMEQILKLDNLYELMLEAEWNEEFGLRPTDDDVLRLGALKSLRKLDLVKATAVTDAAIAKLKAERPELHITRTT